MSILSIKRWEPVTYDAGGGAQIRMELKRLKRHETKPLTKALVACFERFDKASATDISNAERAAMLASVYEAIPENELRSWFATCVRNVEDFEIDGERITTGEGLLENADDGVVFFILFSLQRLAKLAGVESNGSASPSGSSSKEVPAIGAGSSPAESIESEAGREPSTATAIPTTPESSSAPA